MLRKNNLSYIYGYRAEQLVRLYMFILGWRCINHRWKNHINEIDLIFTRFNSVRFVEVKYRSNTGSNIGLFNKKYQSRLWKSANLWIARNQQFSSFNLRFSVFIIGPKFWNWSINDLNSIYNI